MNIKKLFRTGATYYIVSILAIGVAVYCRVTYLGFTHWDDNIYVVENPFIRSLSPYNIGKLFTGTILGNYAPLHLLSYSLDFQLWTLNPAGYHITNLILHLLNAAGIFYLVFMITGRKNVAWLTALLFAVHPVNVETVAWISQRKTLIAQLFFILSFIGYLQFTRRGFQKDYSLSLIFFVCSLLAKVSTIMLPVMLILYDYCYLRKISTKSLVNKLPFLAVSGAFAVIALWAQFVAYGGELHLHGGSAASNIITMIVALKNYVFLILFPLNLSVYYYFSYPSLLSPQVLFSMIVLAGILALLIILKKKREILFWAGWFFIALLPNMNIVPLDAVMGDRYMYLPAVGIFCLIALIVDHNLTKYGFGSLHGAAIVLNVFAVCGILIMLSYHRIGIWKNDLTLWSTTIKTHPSPVAYNNLAVYWGREGDYRKAREDFEKALEIDPDDYQANKNLGSLSMMEKDYYHADIYYRKALSLKPGMEPLMLEMVSMYMERGNYRKAREMLSGIPEKSPYYQEAQRRLVQIKAP